ncbi:hypothetical protein ACIBCM_21155 [Streptomyces sp. NPDC051018]|uniref:hypothetical protein n=1 Tax=Streptomyces sp. NPDC051018 TaxID=3365639 RepID=UPI00378AFFF9
MGSGSELAAAVLLGLGLLCALIAALVPSAVGFAVAAVASYAADWYLHQRGSHLVKRLSRIRFGLQARFLLRQLLLILMLSRLDLTDPPLFPVAIGGFLLLLCLQAPHGALTTLIRQRRVMPVVTRNIDLHGVRIPDAPPRALLHRSAEKMLHLDIPAVAGVLAATRTDTGAPAYAGMAISLGLALLCLAVLCLRLRPNRLVPGTSQVLTCVDAWLRAYRPTVVLYFSGSRNSAYQVRMWVETMERLDARPLIILRERSIVPRLDETSVPVLCVPGAEDLMNLDLSTVRVALYPANVGKNIHLLRVPTMKHVFIGHGDSDKAASVNPFSKVYDEVWTAGRAGRDRYGRAEVGVRDEQIVEVGRPQLAPIEGWTGAPKPPVPTILYAPTWEGWDDGPGNTSLLSAGENIVRSLLKAEPPVRVIYRPHPFTGTRSARAGVVHARITAMIAKAAAERAADPRWAGEPATAQAGRAAAREALADIEVRLAELSERGRPGDEAEMSRVSLAEPQRLAEVTSLLAEWNHAYWRSFDRWEHRTVTGDRPALYDCFNESDGLVSDISSVVSDYIASGKPYAVVDSAAVGAEEFKWRNTAARAAVIVSNSAVELGELLDAVADPAADKSATARRELKRYLLGPEEPASIDRFNAAVAALTARAGTPGSRPAERLPMAPARTPARPPENESPRDDGGDFSISGFGGGWPDQAADRQDRPGHA